MYYQGETTWWMVAASIAVVLFWCAVLFFGIRNSGKGPGLLKRGREEPDEAAIAKRRFALGELSRRELEDVLAATEKKEPPPGRLAGV